MVLPIELVKHVEQKEIETGQLYEAAKGWVEDYFQEGVDRVKTIEQYYWSRVGETIAEPDKGDLHLVEVSWYEEGGIENFSVGLVAKNKKTKKSLLILEDGGKISVDFGQSGNNIYFEMPIVRESDEEIEVVDKKQLVLNCEPTIDDELLGFKKYLAPIELIEDDSDGVGRGIRMWNLSRGLQQTDKLKALLDDSNIIKDSKIYDLNQAKDVVNGFSDYQGVNILDKADLVLGIE